MVESQTQQTKDGDMTYTADQLKEETAKATEGIRAQLSEERKARKETEKQLAELQKTIDDMKAEQEAAAAAKEQSELENKGKYQEALEKATKKHSDELAALNAKIADANKTIEELLIDKEVLSSCGEAVKPEQVLKLMKIENRLKVVTDSDGKHSVEVYDANGAEMFEPIPTEDGGGLKPATVKYAVEKYLEENPNLSKSGVSGGSGSQTGRLPGGAKTYDERLKEAREKGDRKAVIKLKTEKMRAEGGAHALMLGHKQSGAQNKAQE